ncbi:PepSY domain-containing protein [Pelosinus fermentans]|uniref:PepSY domain-containing protein n=1 Tax=Pelosinus fermentans TaxID=365349 RepID=UPI0002685A18|nr:PepSY domain-containing protein [Pelosinus fermentans]EIW21840.1 PepSY-associated TM helix domain protein [Pelosinus fermentans A11]
MKYFQVVRNLHLWLGLALTLFLLIEAVTGLILSEPTLIGAGKTAHVQHSHISTEERKIPTNMNQNFTAEDSRKAEEHAKQISGDVSSLVFIKQLHQGIINSQNFRWIVNVIAIGIIILTLTGLYLSIPLLKAQFKNKT